MQMTGAEALARTLVGYGVDHIFMVPAVLRRTLAELERLSPGVARIHAHGEKAAAYMADGYARASGRVGVCIAQSVGAMNLAAGLRDAHLAHSPVIAFTGGQFPHTKFRKAYQDVDDLPAFEPVTKWNACVDDAHRIPDMVRQAFRVSTSGCPGPVHLRFQGNEAQIENEIGDFDIVVDERFAAVPPFRPPPDPEDLAAVARLLEDAKRPIIVAGGGVIASGAQSELCRLAEKLSMPVATSLNGKAGIPGSHPLSLGVVGTYSRRSANEVVAEADLVFFVGTETGGMTTHFWQVPPTGTRVVQLDIEASAIGRNYPVSAAILGDARLSLEALLEEVRPGALAPRRTWLDRVRTLADAWHAEFEPLFASDQVPLRPERVCRELSEHLPGDAIVVVDTGHSGMWMGGMFDLRHPGQSYIRSAGHLGWAFPAGLGVKCARPERPVLTFTGDSGLWYHLGDLETAVRWNINAVTLVNNNRSGNQMAGGFVRAYGDNPSEGGREMWMFNDVNFARIADDIGALGIRVERPQELEGALARAFEAERPVVLDVVTDIEAMAPRPPSNAR